MQLPPTLRAGAGAHRGITVLGLLLLIIALVIAAIFLVSYFRSRPAAALTPPAISASSA